MDEIYLSIVIPAYNEENRLPGSLQTILNYLAAQDFRSEIIVVDDGSSDQTYNRSSEFKKDHPNLTVLKNEKNSGKGYSVQRGVFASKGKYILFSDADLSTPISELEKFYGLFDKGIDVIIAARNLPGSLIKIKQPLHREISGYVYRKLNRILFNHGLHDTQCGFKGFQRDAAMTLFKKQTVCDFAFDIEIMLIARLMGYSIEEVPVLWNNDDDSRVKFVSDSLKMFKSLIRMKINIIQDRYSIKSHA